MNYRAYILVAFTVVLAACAPSNHPITDGPTSGSNSGSSTGGGSSSGGNSSSSLPTDDSKIALDSYGESFQASIASKLKNSHYMEQNCTSVTTWNEYKNLPMQRCRYSSDGQTVEVLMLNPGPRRLTLWLEEACGSLAGNFSQCVQKSFNQILYQSGGQFPVAGIVVEDMDENGKGNAYAFRNGVTVQISAFGTATESRISQSQIDRSFTDAPIKTYSYARPISATRTQLADYARAHGLSIPSLGTSSAETNNFNTLVGDWYRQAWRSSQNHVIRAWVYAQGY